MNRRSSGEQAVQEIGGISRLALKGLYHELVKNRWSSEKEAVQEIRGTQQVSIKGTVS
jgi:hypothetical protein